MSERSPFSADQPFPLTPGAWFDAMIVLALVLGIVAAWWVL